MKRFLLADIPYLQTKTGRTRAFTCGDPLPIELAPLAWEPARAHRAAPRRGRGQGGGHVSSARPYELASSERLPISTIIVRSLSNTSS